MEDWIIDQYLTIPAVIKVYLIVLLIGILEVSDYNPTWVDEESIYKNKNKKNGNKSNNKDS